MTKAIALVVSEKRRHHFTELGVSIMSGGAALLSVLYLLSVLFPET